MIVIERVELSKNPVRIKEQYIISNYLGHSTHGQLKKYTHHNLRSRGTTE